jgi:hypothetical protein
VDDTETTQLGPADLHDGRLFGVQDRGGRARVLVRGVSGRTYRVDFAGVRSLVAHRPEGMVLYALSELPGEPGARRFSFINRGDDGARLEIVAKNVGITLLSPTV